MIGLLVARHAALAERAGTPATPSRPAEITVVLDAGQNRVVHDPWCAASSSGS
jgi:hypothetical protein